MDGTAESREGTQFGPYRLRRLVGRGGMGDVYEAEDTVRERIVALKLMSETLSSDPVFRTRMQREARTAGRLQEPHVVPIHDFGEIDGLSAFYYALLLLLAGFTGSIVVSTLVDSMLGYVPAEFGPVYRFAEQVNISRFRTLLVKWAVMVVLALLTSGVYLAIAHGLGMPIPLGWQVWLYGVFAIIAVGVTSSSLIAVLGSMGLLVSMLIFVILGLPSAGATVPLEAVPAFFRWLAQFEPMHQVFLGVRSLLYLNGNADAGLSQALTMTSIGLIIGLLLGGFITHLYDRSSFHRIPGAVEMAIAVEHQAQYQARQSARESSSEQP